MTEDKNKAMQFQLPYAVPKGMRTRRGLPRSLAAVLVFAWILVVAISSVTLARNDSSTLSPFAKLFSEEQSQWGVYLSETNTTCDSYLTSKFRSGDDLPSISGGIPPKSELHVEGQSVLRHQDTPVLFTTSLRFGFNAYRVLESLEMRLRIGEGEMQVRSLGETDELMIDIDVGPIKTQYPLGKVPAVFLTQRGANAFDAQVPPEVTRMLEGISANAQHFQAFRELNEKEFEKCKATLKNLDTLPLESLLDVSSFLVFLPSHLRDGIAEAMLRQKTTSSDNNA